PRRRAAREADRECTHTCLRERAQPLGGFARERLCGLEGSDVDAFRMHVCIICPDRVTSFGHEPPSAPVISNSALRFRMNRSTAVANPSSLLLSVTKSAALCTSGLALPMAMLRPAHANIATSLLPSPMAAIWAGGMASKSASLENAVPLLAPGLVMSR